MSAKKKAKKTATSPSKASPDVQTIEDSPQKSKKRPLNLVSPSESIAVDDSVPRVRNPENSANNSRLMQT